MKIDGSSIELKWLGHSGFMIRNSKIIYIDPYMIKENSEKADIILITHSHYDHCSVADIGKIIKEGTRVILTADSQSKITKFNVPIKIEIVEFGKQLNIGEIKIAVVPAYNIDKSFHPKDEGWVGYLLKIENVLIYHAGDTDLIPEMKNLTGYKQSGKNFFALLPIGGRFTMNPEEAAEAASIIKPTAVIPMHYGSVVGTGEELEDFKHLCKEKGIDVLVLERE
ncbi:MAG: MBL fold metallo-hydrolase [Nanoarchaeota archaeon]